MILRNLVGRCYFCNREISEYRTDISFQRFCCTSGLPQNVKAGFGDDFRLFPTIYPEPATASTESDLAPSHPARRPMQDGFAVAMQDERDGTTDSQDQSPTMPFENVPVLDHLRCGNPNMYNLGERATSFGFQPNKVEVCDMTSYLWSSTLKDPRSWAVMHNALASGIKHLGVWTAGNAGFSMARLAYVVNRNLRESQRLRVYCYGVSGEFPDELRFPLQRLRAHVSIFAPIMGGILKPEVALNRLNASLPRGLQIPESEYWDVSDGWDGVALYMYRLLGRQLCMHLKPKFIVAPVGTGDFFFGLYLGRKDIQKAGYISASDCRLIAAVPAGDSVLTAYHKRGLKVPTREPAFGKKPAVAPKLATIYTPLLLVMYSALRDSSVEVVRVTEEEQRHAAQLLYGQRIAPELAAEPSALIAFGALRSVANLYRAECGITTGDTAAEGADASTIVVNTGCGIMGSKEAGFLHSFVEAPGAA